MDKSSPLSSLKEKLARHLPLETSMVWLKKRWLACLGICRQWRDFVTLARFDRPIGIYLLLWPTLWGLWLAADGWPGWHLFLVFTLGCVLTRSAGCVANDLWDRDFDHRVERTRERPITTGKITHRQAILFMGLLLLLALALVLTTNRLTIYLSLGAVFIAGVYPLMKRITHMPQAVLGIAFSWGIPMAFAATQHHIPHTAWLLVVANLLWTIAYDTQYAMVDREDDLKIGLKSSAILFGDLDKVMVGILQAAFVITMLVVGYRFELGFWFHLGLVIATCLMLYQQFLIRERERNACFRAFLNNHWAGFAIFLGIVCELYLKTPA